MDDFTLLYHPLLEYLIEENGENFEKSNNKIAVECKDDDHHKAIESPRSKENDILSETLKYFIIEEEAKLCGFRVKSQGLSHNSGGIELEQYRSICCRLDRILRKALILIQETEVVERGYSLGSHLPPLQRLQKNLKATTCKDLRKSFHICSSRISDKILVILGGVVVEEVNQAEETPSLETLKAAMQRQSRQFIDLYIHLLKLDREEVFHLLDLVSEIAKSSAEVMEKCLAIFSDLQVQSCTDLQVDTTGETKSKSVYLIRELSILIDSTKPLKDKHMLALLLAKSENLVQELKSQLDILHPTPPTPGPVEESVLQPCTPLEPFTKEDSSQILFEGVSDAIVESSSAKKWEFSRSQRIAHARSKPKQPSVPLFEFLSELQTVLKQKMRNNLLGNL